MFFIDGAAGPNEVKLQRWYRLSGQLVPANGQGEEGPWS
jgi:hypothetical protein